MAFVIGIPPGRRMNHRKPQPILQHPTYAAYCNWRRRSVDKCVMETHRTIKV